MTHHVKVCCDSCPLQAVPGRETSLGLVIRDVSFLSPLSPHQHQHCSSLEADCMKMPHTLTPSGLWLSQGLAGPHPKGPKFPLSTGARETQASPLILAKASRSLLTRGGAPCGRASSPRGLATELSSHATRQEPGSQPHLAISVTQSKCPNLPVLVGQTEARLSTGRLLELGCGCITECVSRDGLRVWHF